MWRLLAFCGTSIFCQHSMQCSAKKVAKFGLKGKRAFSKLWGAQADRDNAKARISKLSGENPQDAS